MNKKLFGFKAALAWEDCYGVVEAVDEKAAEEKVREQLAKKSFRGVSMVMAYEIKIEDGLMIFYSDYKGD